MQVLMHPYRDQLCRGKLCGVLRVYRIDRARLAAIRRERLRRGGLFIGVSCWLVVALGLVSALVWGC